MTSGGNKFNDFPENEVTKFCAEFGNMHVNNAIHPIAIAS